MAGNIVVGILRALLTADSAEFVDGMRVAADDTAKFSKDMKAFGKQIGDAGQAVLPLSLAVAGVGVASMKAAIDFESSFAGIRKTVGDATDSMGNLTARGKEIQDGMRDMAKTIPVNVNELNKIGEAAGQLGIKSENILGFTRVIADLGVTTNLSSEEAAMSLAKFATSTQMPQENMDRLASTIVALGNNSNTTEADIVAMGMRIAGAGHQVGLTEAQIMGVAASLSSVGIEAEAGGSAISKVMVDMALAVAKGGNDLSAFAKVAGMSSAGFKTAFQTDAAAALGSFITGLGDMKGHGQSAIKVLDDMGITEVRMRDALLRSAGAGELFNDTIAIGTKAWADNNALTKEAEQRYRTFESQLVVLWNQLKDVAITLGTAMMPAMQNVMNVFKSFVPYLEAAATWFAELSPGLQAVVIGVGVFVAALGPALIAIGAVVSAVGTIGAALAFFEISLAALLGPIALVAAAVAGLAYVWYRWGDDITKVVVDTFNTVKQYMVDMWDGSIFQAVARMLYAMGELFLAFAGVVIDAIRGKLEPVFSWFGNVWQTVASAFTAGKDAVLGIVGSMVTGIRQWLSDNLGPILDGVKAKIDAVTGFFRDMHEKVVGHSYVPDMVNGIDKAFAQLQAAMVAPTQKATTEVGKFFQGMASEVKELMGRLTGEDLAIGAMKLEAAFRALPPALKENADAIKNTLTEYEKFRGHVDLALVPSLNALFLANGTLASSHKLVGSALASVIPIYDQGVTSIDQLRQRTIEAGEATAGMSNILMTQAAPAVLSSAKASDMAAVSYGSVWDNLDKMSASFAQLAQIGGESTAALVKGFGSVTASIGAAKTGFSSLSGGFKSMTSGGGLSSIMGGIGSMVTGIGGIATAAMAAFQGVKALIDSFKSEETKFVNKPRDQFFSSRGGEAATALQITNALAAQGDTESGVHADALMKQLYAADTKETWAAIQKKIIDLIGGNSFALGTPGLGAVDFGPGQLAMLHGPEFVVPESRLGDFVGQFAPAQTINIYQDGVLTTQRVVRNMPRVLALHGVG